MRIGFFTDSYLPNIDGVVSALLGYKRELCNRGHGVYVFSAGDSKTKRLNKDRTVFYYDSVPFPPYPAYRLAVFPFALSSTARKAKLDIIHSHAVTMMGLGSIKAASDLKLPLVGTFHTMLPLAARAYYKKYKVASLLADRIMWRATSAFYKPFDLVTAPTKTICDILNENGIENTFVVPNGVDTARFNPRIDRRPIRKILGLGADEKMIVCSGRLSFEKNVDVLVRAAKLLDDRGEDFRLVITGDGPSRDAVKKQINDLGLERRAVSIGFCQSYELPFYYAAADVYATASTFETQGLAMLEAMACGTPVVGANSLAIPESVRSGFNGYLFEPGSAEDCAEQLERIFDASPAKRACLGRNARRTALALSVERSTDRLLEAYSQVI